MDKPSSNRGAPPAGLDDLLTTIRTQGLANQRKLMPTYPQALI